VLEASSLGLDGAQTLTIFDALYWSKFWSVAVSVEPNKERQSHKLKETKYTGRDASHVSHTVVAPMLSCTSFFYNDNLY